MRKIFFATALLLAGCETTPTINSDFDPSVNFANYRTYSCIYTAPPQGMNPLTYERVRASIDRSLAARGYTQATPGDFAVAFTLGKRDAGKAAKLMLQHLENVEKRLDLDRDVRPAVDLRQLFAGRP